MNDKATILNDIILHRRSTKPALMNGKQIDNEQVEFLLKLADWAPTHARSEPWRFVVYSGEALTAFSQQHAELYRSSVDREQFLQNKYDAILHTADFASHLIVSVMQRTAIKIPAIEEVAAVSCAIQNILLGATALGIASFWSTGGMAHHHSMKELYALNEHDLVMGLLYLGYTDELQEGKRSIPLNEKVQWKK
jgi:nitroreductase